MSALKRVVVGLDPGSGASSPTGFAAFDPDSMSLLFCTEIRSTEKAQSRRLREFHEQAFELMASIDPEVELFVFIESFFIRGRGNQVLQQVIGALKAAAPEHAHLDDVANTTMKKLVGGHGRAEKVEVAAGLAKLMSKNAESVLAIKGFVAANRFDVIDAIGIGMAGYIAHSQEK